MLMLLGFASPASSLCCNVIGLFVRHIYIPQLPMDSVTYYLPVLKHFETFFIFLSGTNEAAVIEVLARRTIAQRQRIKEAYKQSVGKVLIQPTRKK